MSIVQVEKREQDNYIGKIIHIIAEWGCVGSESGPKKIENPSRQPFKGEVIYIKSRIHDGKNEVIPKGQLTIRLSMFVNASDSKWVHGACCCQWVEISKRSDITLTGGQNYIATSWRQKRILCKDCWEKRTEDDFSFFRCMWMVWWTLVKIIHND